MANVAIIEAKKSNNRYLDFFPFEFDQFTLCSDPKVTKVLKKDVDLDFDSDAYEWVILIGSEPLKHFTKVTKVMDYAGTIVEDKFLPTINPSMLAFKPEAKNTWEKSIENICAYISGDKKKAEINEEVAFGIQNTEEANEFIRAALDSPGDFVALDSETTALYPRNGHILGISMCYDGERACYIDADYLDESSEELLQELFDKKRVVFHNAKFDIAFFEYHFNVKVSRFEDTMLMHYVIDERPGHHGLKRLAMQLTDFGDYEKPMYDWMDQYRKEHGILKDDFKWEWIPFDIMKTYAAIDALATYQIFVKFEGALNRGNAKLKRVYQTILLPACRFLMDIQDNGVPFCRSRLGLSQDLMAEEIYEAADLLSQQEAIQRFQSDEGKEFNPNSVMQLRKVLFDYAGLEPTGITTEKGEHSTNSEVLEKLSTQHDIPRLILDIRKKSKIKNTYLDKIIPQLDADSRLRTNFNLHGTTSGRLSSSGKLNMQQIPRDNPIVKGCIRASEGHKIVAMDLTTAEVYVAAVLADDLELQEVFRSGGNFHSTIAHKVFRLDCEVDEVAEKYGSYRQAAKAVTFGIMYGAGPNKIAEQVTKDGGSMTVPEAKRVIKDYFGAFWKLEEWINEQQDFIRRNGHVYSYFGRKRRLPEGKNQPGQKPRDFNAQQSHAIRSGLNFLVQSAASDINLLGAVEAHSMVQTRGMKSRIFALVHDSVLAEVPLDEIDEYSNILRECIQRDRGIMIPGCPVGCDFEIGEDYSMGKFNASGIEL